MPTLLGETKDPNITISLDQLGAPGIQGVLEIVPYFTNEAGDNPAPKPSMCGPTDFEVRAKLAKSSTLTVLDGAFGTADGSSYMMVAEDHICIQVDDGFGTLRMDKNPHNEISMVSGNVNAINAGTAKNIFSNRLNLFIDRIAYLASIPIYIDILVVKNISTDVQSIFFVSPPRPSLINSGGETLQTELAPVYALYREAQNSNSPYYRVLCLFKIMEGLLGPLRTELNKRAKSVDVIIETSKAIVPNDFDIPSGLQYLTGQPIKKVFDNFFQKQFRDAMAHFSLRGKTPLNVSESLHWARFMDVAFVANLCARALIVRHEQSIATLSATVQDKAAPQGS